MKYLLDTDITSYLMKRNHPLHKQILKKLLSCQPETIAISSITVSEIVSGFNQISDQNILHKKRIKQALDHFITNIPVLDFTLASAVTYGEIRAYLKSHGKDIGAMDCLIAAHALTENRILVTNNLKHFSRIKNLNLENWCD